ncbi:MAG: hypothetical protein NZ651_01475 [Candidatus Bipolaricaulota bacterium]|nr:hypothetical protein [Candidatus Bipolaricaulota bacterium]MDW8126433.1 hypothetical protein [Candidatus Bipolaricaulota bacterium]
MTFLWILVIGLSMLAVAQADILDFPVGLTEMVWTLRGVGAAQELRLSVEGLPDGRYRVTLGLRLEGTGSELSALGFFGAPLLVQAMGTQIDLSSLSVLIRRREMLTVGERYALPGGEFYAREKAEIAGVPCLVGEFRPQDRTDTVIEVGFSLGAPVYLLPLLRVQDKGRTTFEMILTEYRRP